MNPFRLNRQRLSRAAAREMRYFDHIFARTQLLWSVLTLTGISLLFCGVYYLNQNRATENLNAVWLTGGLFVLYAAVCLARRVFIAREGESFVCAMAFTSLSILVTAAVAYLMFRAAWYWEFQGFIPGGAVRLMRGILPRCLWAPALVLAAHIVLLFVPDTNAPLWSSRLYYAMPVLPLVPPVAILLLAFNKDILLHSVHARAFTTVYLSLCFALAVHYLFKAAAYLILLHSDPAEPQTPINAQTLVLTERLKELLTAAKRKLVAAKATVETKAAENVPIAAQAEPNTENIPAAPQAPRNTQMLVLTERLKELLTTAKGKLAAAKATVETKTAEKTTEVETAPAEDTKAEANAAPAEEAKPEAESQDAPKPKKPRKKKAAPKAEAETNKNPQ